MEILSSSGSSLLFSMSSCHHHCVSVPREDKVSGPSRFAVVGCGVKLALIRVGTVVGNSNLQLRREQGVMERWTKVVALATYIPSNYCCFKALWSSCCKSRATAGCKTAKIGYPCCWPPLKAWRESRQSDISPALLVRCALL